MFSKSYYVIIDHDFSAPVHIIEVLYGLNVAEKIFLFKLLADVQLLGSKGFDTHMILQSATHRSYVSLAH